MLKLVLTSITVPGYPVQRGALPFAARRLPTPGTQGVMRRAKKRGREARRKKRVSFALDEQGSSSDPTGPAAAPAASSSRGQDHVYACRRLHAARNRSSAVSHVDLLSDDIFHVVVQFLAPFPAWMCMSMVARDKTCAQHPVYICLLISEDYIISTTCTLDPWQGINDKSAGARCHGRLHLPAKGWASCRSLSPCQLKQFVSQTFTESILRFLLVIGSDTQKCVKLKSAMPNHSAVHVLNTMSLPPRTATVLQPSSESQTLSFSGSTDNLVMTF